MNVVVGPGVRPDQGGLAAGVDDEDPLLSTVFGQAVHDNHGGAADGLAADRRVVLTRRILASQARPAVVLDVPKSLRWSLSGAFPPSASRLPLRDFGGSPCGSASDFPPVLAAGTCGMLGLLAVVGARCPWHSATGRRVLKSLRWSPSVGPPRSAGRLPLRGCRGRLRGCVRDFRQASVGASVSSYCGLSRCCWRYSGACCGRGRIPAQEPRRAPWTPSC